MHVDLGIEFYLLDANGVVFPLTAGTRYLFGRSEEASVVLNDTLCSREHCELAWTDRHMPVIRDLGSRNGTYVNGKRVESFAAVTDGDQLQIGGNRFSLSILPSGSDIQTVVERQAATDFKHMETFELQDDAATAGAATFSGRLRDGNMAGMLRFFSLTDKTGRLDLGDERHCIWFMDGTPRDALCEAERGLDALIHMVKDPGDTFTFHEGRPLPDEATITGSERSVLAAVVPATELADFGIDAADLERAESVQKHLLERVPDLPGYRIGLYYRGLSAISGDCYDIGHLVDGRILVFLADVSGHGIQAALVVTNLLKTLRLLRGHHHDLIELMTAFNDEVRPDLIAGQFCTVFAALLDPASGQVQVVLAGHHAGLRFPLGSGHPIDTIGQRGLGIGLAAGDQFRRGIHLQEFILAPGEILLQYTDGAVESVDDAGQEFGLERLQTSITRHAGGTPQSLVDGIAGDVLAHAVDMKDDLTVLALARDTDDGSRRYARSQSRPLLVDASVEQGTRSYQAPPRHKDPARIETRLPPPGRHVHSSTAIGPARQPSARETTPSSAAASRSTHSGAGTSGLRMQLGRLRRLVLVLIVILILMLLALAGLVAVVLLGR